MSFDVKELTISLVKIDKQNAAFVLEFKGQKFEYKFSSCRNTQAECPIQPGPAQMLAAGTTSGTLKQLKKALNDALKKLKEFEPEPLDSRQSQRSGKSD